MSEHNAFSNKLKDIYQSLFCQQWPALTGGILLGLLSILILAWSRPWGIVGGIRNWADWLFYGIGVFSEKPMNAFLHSSSVMDMGLILGAFASALMAKEFALRIPPKIEIIKGIIGGILMGVGSSLAIGCNVGAFYSPLINLSASGFPMMAGLIIGAYIGLRCILWELERFPPETTGFVATKKEQQKGFDWKASQPWFGTLIFISLVVWAYLYGSLAYTQIGGLLLFGTAFGVVLQRCRFCFVRAFRDPFMTGEAGMVGAVAVSTVIGSVGVAILKWNGFRNESVYVVPAFWWGGLIGGIIFGIGMVIAGGCGSGTLWRVAEGQLKLWIALFVFAASNSLMTAMLHYSGWRSKLGSAIFLPDFFGWSGSLILILFVLFVWYMILFWNEETNKFTII
ncbi:YeeE/YedE thiosulfate transporter family protein [Desulfobacterales bacterium HSG2]|nr:YeeE/YedE thiosulfate transporter family protein [Desulfobacterales bacterium HSG2]